MRTKYIDLIEQTFDFPQDEFALEDDVLQFHGIDLMALIAKYGTPLKFNYLPQISNNIQRCKGWFSETMNTIRYTGSYNYSYCTKSSHFSFVLDEVLKNDVHLETSSSYDIDIINHLLDKGKITNDPQVICNGYKPDKYIDNIAGLINDNRIKVLPVMDNADELDRLVGKVNRTIDIGIRIASEEDPKFEFYTSRLGMRYRDILPYYLDNIKDNEKVNLKMLHFFINTGIDDNAYYWNELTKSLRVYCELKKVCPSLDSLNIGGGFPIKKSLAFDYDYPYMVKEILLQIQSVCKEYDIPEPNIFTEFGSFTVGESGGAIFKIIAQKQQNDREKWNMIDSSFMTNLPDTWAINQRFVMLPINGWNEKYERVLLGGLTCDSDDYYNSEQHVNAIYLPKFTKDKDLYIGFFNTGAYQETIGGFGGLKHCLIPEPKHILISRDKMGVVQTEVFSEQQNASDYLAILGYQK
ncbi:arginine decarboxylase [Lishizhenia tianjinensis]|uniref:Arginine decarboxylase n=1 Tax=Lishizhenia tianjinensis TaxID=477690 RepID=A0A1I6ZSW4_9FLAO|nr:arginine decarboxylase [Lishizhenia tianjinensis]SFT65784.1 arginine decarboxylase [Lishizhenia tianjinensis]